MSKALMTDALVLLSEARQVSSAERFACQTLHNFSGKFSVIRWSSWRTITTLTSNSKKVERNELHLNGKVQSQLFDVKRTSCCSTILRAWKQNIKTHMVPTTLRLATEYQNMVPTTLRLATEYQDPYGTDYSTVGNRISRPIWYRLLYGWQQCCFYFILTILEEPGHI